MLTLSLNPSLINITIPLQSFPGPALSGTLVNSIGFKWMLYGVAILSFLYAPLLFLLRAPPSKDEKKV